MSIICFKHALLLRVLINVRQAKAKQGNSSNCFSFSVNKQKRDGKFSTCLHYFCYSWKIYTVSILLISEFETLLKQMGFLLGSRDRS